MDRPSPPVPPRLPSFFFPAHGLSPPVSFFFFQAEDGIRVTSVTGFQTCALPILKSHIVHSSHGNRAAIIKDYCIGGMYVELIDNSLLGEPASTYAPRIGDVINVVTNINGAGVQKQLNFNTKVMRVEQDYVR